MKVIDPDNSPPAPSLIIEWGEERKKSLVKKYMFRKLR
jgi:hypothetical protein